MSDQLGSTEPWHLWGSEKTVTFGGFTAGRGTEQLARIEYKRPETWSFYLFAELVDGQIDPVNVQSFSCRFDLAFGVGRSVFVSSTRQTLEGFAAFQWVVPAGVKPGAQQFNKKYASCVLGPPLNDAEPDQRERIEWITAQNIQSTASCGGTSGGAVRVGTFFAPRTHIRPDWFKYGKGFDLDKFRGNETGGT